MLVVGPELGLDQDGGLGHLLVESVLKGQRKDNQVCSEEMETFVIALHSLDTVWPKVCGRQELRTHTVLCVLQEQEERITSMLTFVKMRFFPSKPDLQFRFCFVSAVVVIPVTRTIQLSCDKSAKIRVSMNNLINKYRIIISPTLQLNS